MSVCGAEKQNKAFRPLIPGVKFIEFNNQVELASQIILKCLEKGLLLFWLLFESNAIRITSPLTISDKEIEEGCKIILQVVNEVVEQSAKLN